MMIIKKPKHFSIVISLLALVGCDNRHKVIIDNVRDYLDENLPVMNNYKPISYRIVDTILKMDVIDELSPSNDSTFKLFGKNTESQLSDSSKKEFNYALKAVNLSSYGKKIVVLCGQKRSEKITSNEIKSIALKTAYYYKLLKTKYYNLPTYTTFADSIAVSTKEDLAMVYKLIHKYRINMHGDNKLQIDTLYLDINYKVFRMCNQKQ
ncbi:hypothetical protein FPZ43_05860 [Mucilaginibacter pallidiroseus]|uniref:Lipoprotein n=1 Tax=Mucilaginibacter pallidiroseus TaxID=2599295 RepID=A0A563UGH1_9SPHI|nr:hypothetical protein [Mucilaginibacter pallidiroseus]TWR30465.1 hypothetical protein FPZ43_05860 [Mucilaginibacter pallidiroseus]